MRWVKRFIIGPDYLVYILNVTANVIIEEVLSVSTTSLGAEPPGLHVTAQAEINDPLLCCCCFSSFFKEEGSEVYGEPPQGFGVQDLFAFCVIRVGRRERGSCRKPTQPEKLSLEPPEEAKWPLPAKGPRAVCRDLSKGASTGATACL